MRYRILPSDNSTAGVKFVDHFTFKIGHTVPLYEVSSVAALNQLIGYAKYINKDYGNVYYRGVKGLFDSISPSIMRNRQSGEAYDLKQLLTNVSNHQYLRKTLKLIKTIRPINEDDHVYNALVTRTNRNVIEAMLQHYAGYTRFIDVVNNHWIALWMGLHEFRICGEGRSFIACHKRTLDTGDIINFINSGKNNPDWLKDNLYEYIILIAMPHFKCTPIMGVYESSNLVEVDLRKALPSFFVRPHAQHALAIRKREAGQPSPNASLFDMADQSIGIIRVRVDLADQWLGNGILVSKENFFPLPSVDQGYNTLLKNELFVGEFEIKKYF